MGHWSWFRGCESAEEAVAVSADFGMAGEEVAGNPFGPLHAAKYRIPLFWLAGFSASDITMVRSPFSSDDDPEIEEMAILSAPGPDIARRLRARREAVLSAIRPDHGELYDRWCARVEALYHHWILVECSDVFSMSGVPESSTLLVAAIERLDASDRGATLELSGPFEMLSAGDPSMEGLWAPPPIRQREWCWTGRSGLSAEPRTSTGCPGRHRGCSISRIGN